MRLLFFLLSTVFFSGFSAYGQQSIFKEKGERFYEKAVLCELHHQPEKAIDFYKKSIRANPENEKSFLALANLYRKNQDFKAASEVLKNCPHPNAETTFQLASDLFRSGDYVQANSVLNKISSEKQATSAFRNQIDLLRANIRLAGYSDPMIKDSLAYPVNLGSRINSEYDEYFPSISLNDSVIVFTRKTNGIDQDFYIAHRDSCGGWFAANSLGVPPNSPSQEGAQMLSADGHYLFFSRCQNQSLNGWAQGGCDLFFSYDVPGGWSQPVPFGATINTPAYEGMPSLSPDNKILYFVSDRNGGYGGKDIWMSRFEDGLWQVPENLGPAINTSGDETAPWIASDNQTLYFTSNGHPGLGGEDLYLSRKQPDGTWGAPIDLAAPINSPSDDVSITVANNGKKVYFASNRAGGFGGMDIYRALLPEPLQPQPRTFVYGIVKDSLTGAPLTIAVLTWTDALTGASIAQYESNRGDASYIAAFPLDTQLALEVSRYNYLTVNDTFLFHKKYSFPPDTLDISLLPFGYNPPLSDTTLLTVYFQKNTFTLTDSVKAWVKNIVTPFKDGKYNEFYVDGFTDTSGYPAINEDISVQRANALRMVLLALGVPEDKVHSQGWSDSNPVGSNQTEEGRAQNRRAVLVLRRPE